MCTYQPTRARINSAKKILLEEYMKKIIAAVSAIILTGFVFAQDAAAPAKPAPAWTFCGVIKTGLQFKAGDSNKDGSVLVYNNDAGKPSRFDFSGTYVNSDVGAAFKLREQTSLATSPVVKYAYAWGNYFDGKVTLKAGNIDDAVWETEGDVNYDIVNGPGSNSLGAVAQFKPVAGLNVGLKVSASPTVAQTSKQTLNELGFGAGYTSDLFNFQAGYQLDSDVDDITSTAKTTYKNDPLTNIVTATTTTTVNDAYASDHAYAYFGANYKGIKQLTAIVEGQFANLGAFGDIGLTTIDETIEYAVSDPLSLGALSYQVVSNVDGAKTEINFKPYANYSLSKIVTLNGKVFYELNSGNVKDINTFYVQPGATFTIGKTSIIAFYRYNVSDLGDKSAAGKQVDNIVQVDFIWKF